MLLVPLLSVPYYAIWRQGCQLRYRELFQGPLEVSMDSIVFGGLPGERPQTFAYGLVICPGRNLAQDIDARPISMVVCPAAPCCMIKPT